MLQEISLLGPPFRHDTTIYACNPTSGAPSPHLYFFWLGPSTAFSTVPAMPPLAASNWLPMAPSLEKGPPICYPHVSSTHEMNGVSTPYLLADLADGTVGVELLANGAAGGDDGRVLCDMLSVSGLLFAMQLLGRTDGLVSLAWPACSAASWMGFLSAMVRDETENARMDDALEVVERKTVRSMFNCEFCMRRVRGLTGI